MNDFTKEELESLISTIKSLRVYTEINNWDEDLEIKIQSMIDNYRDPNCNHKEIVTGAYPRSNPPEKCEICGVLYR